MHRGYRQHVLLSEPFTALPGRRPASDRVSDFLGGYVPEGSHREQMAATRRIDKDDQFALLSEFGGSIAGAVTLRPSDEDTKASHRYETLTDAQLSARLKQAQGDSDQGIPDDSRSTFPATAISSPAKSTFRMRTAGFALPAVPRTSPSSDSTVSSTGNASSSTIRWTWCGPSASIGPSGTEVSLVYDAMPDLFQDGLINWNLALAIDGIFDHRRISVERLLAEVASWSVLSRSRASAIVAETLTSLDAALGSIEPPRGSPPRMAEGLRWNTTRLLRGSEIS